MREKKTEELIQILKSTHLGNFQDYYEKNKDSMYSEATSFQVYVKNLAVEKKMTLRQIFIKAEIGEGYGYKLLSGEKRTRQRDVIIRLCYATEMSLEEAQRALKKYGMLELYAKNPRDAFLALLFRERPGDLQKVNELLEENGFDKLQACGE